MTPQKFDFEGEQLTVAEVRLRVPALSDSAIRSALKAGRNSSHAMLNFDPARAAHAAGKRGAKTTGDYIRNAKYGSKRRGD